MLTIKVLGSGCANCRKLGELTERVVKSLGVDAEVIKVTDFGEIARYAILSTPGLVIDEKVVSAGRIPSESQITTYITTALAEADAR